MAYNRETFLQYPKSVVYGVCLRLQKSTLGAYAGHSVVCLRDSEGKLWLGEYVHEDEEVMYFCRVCIYGQFLLYICIGRAWFIKENLISILELFLILNIDCFHQA